MIRAFLKWCTWPERIAVAAAILLLAESFLPWYALRWSTTNLSTGRTTEHVVTASAWSSSTGWSAAIVFAVAGVAGWLLCARRPPLRVAAWFTGSGAAILALVIATTTFVAIPVAANSSPGLAYLTPDRGELGTVTRDALTGIQYVTWGFYTALALMLVIAGSLAAAGTPARTNRSTDPEDIRPGT